MKDDLLRQLPCGGMTVPEVLAILGADLSGTEINTPLVSERVVLRYEMGRKPLGFFLGGPYYLRLDFDREGTLARAEVVPH